MAVSSISKRLGAAILTAEIRVRLGSEIRRRRRAKGLTQAQLAAPLTRAYVCSIERGHAAPSLASLALFARRLDVSVGELLSPLEPLLTHPPEGFTSS